MNENKSKKRKLEYVYELINFFNLTSTFMAGLFVILPIILTFVVIGWFTGPIQTLIGPDSLFGNLLRFMGIGENANQIITTLLGWGIILGGIWGLGLLVKLVGKNKVKKLFNLILNRIPIINSFYGTFSQVVDMFERDTREEMKGMQVVYCDFGSENGVGFLGLLASEQTYQFHGQKCGLVYIPTSPIPMSGGILFVPVETIQKVEMEVEQLLQIYFSIGVMSPKVVPGEYITKNNE